MKLAVPIILAVSISFFSCNSNQSETGQKLFCDTLCNNEPIIFQEATGAKPYAKITLHDCIADTIHWGNTTLERKIALGEYVKIPPKVNKSAISAYLTNPSFAYVQFNNCESGRGYFFKLPLDKKNNIDRIASCLSSHDAKFNIEEGLLAYTDKGNIFIEDMKTSKQATATFGELMEMDFDDIHTSIDSLHVTKDKVWVKIYKNQKWETMELKPVWGQ